MNRQAAKKGEHPAGADGMAPRPEQGGFPRPVIGWCSHRPEAARTRRILTLLILSSSLFASGLSGPGGVHVIPEDKRAENGGRASDAYFRVDSNLALIRVTVSDPLGSHVAGLDRDSFRVYEDKVQQTIVSFGSEDTPVSIGIVFDTSGSMGAKLERSRRAVLEFFDTANPDDEAFLVEFSDRPQLITPMTHNLEEIRNQLMLTRSKGRTALIDAVCLALQAMKQANNPRKVLLVISDGGDNRSRYTRAELRHLVQETDVQIYAIGIYEPADDFGETSEEVSGPGLLSDISEPTGGRHVAVDNLAELPDVAAKIGLELRNQYVLGYVPSNGARDGKYRRVSVKVNAPRGLPPLTLSWRLGYYAPR